MNKVMVTGLAISKDIGGCDVCNFDLSWLIENPSTLIWADKIILTPTMWDRIQTGTLGKEKHEFGESVKILFDRAKAENIIEISNPAEIITKKTKEVIFTQIKSDYEALAETFPGIVTYTPEKPSEDGKISPEELRIGDFGYCPPYILSIYSSLILSRIWGAQCLFSQQSLQFCKYRFGLASRTCDSQNKAFHSVFTSLMPNESILPHIATTNSKLCKSCGKLDDCRKTYKKELELTLGNIFKWRDYDEVQQVKAVLESIINKVSQQKELINHQDILDEFHDKELFLERKIRHVFPKVKRYSNIITLLSIPIAVLGVATDATLMTVASATIGGLAIASQQIVELLQSKFSWVGFLPKQDID